MFRKNVGIYGSNIRRETAKFSDRCYTLYLSLFIVNDSFFFFFFFTLLFSFARFVVLVVEGLRLKPQLTHKVFYLTGFPTTQKEQVA
jgi:hypothetical protein